MSNTHKMSVGRTIVLLLIFSGTLSNCTNESAIKESNQFDKGHVLAKSSNVVDENNRLGDDHEVWNSRSVVFINSGRFKEALENTDKALQINPIASNEL